MVALPRLFLCLKSRCQRLWKAPPFRLPAPVCSHTHLRMHRGVSTSTVAAAVKGMASEDCRRALGKQFQWGGCSAPAVYVMVVIFPQRSGRSSLASSPTGGSSPRRPVIPLHSLAESEAASTAVVHNSSPSGADGVVVVRGQSDGAPALARTSAASSSAGVGVDITPISAVPVRTTARFRSAPRPNVHASLRTPHCTMACSLFSSTTRLYAFGMFACCACLCA